MNNYNFSSFNPTGMSQYNSGYPYFGSNNKISSSDESRIIGAGFAFPFLLGGVTGAAIAPAFWRPPYNRPYYGSYYGPGAFYGPYRPF